MVEDGAWVDVWGKVGASDRQEAPTVQRPGTAQIVWS